MRKGVKLCEMWLGGVDLADRMRREAKLNGQKSGSTLDFVSLMTAEQRDSLYTLFSLEHLLKSALKHHYRYGLL